MTKIRDGINIPWAPWRRRRAIRSWRETGSRLQASATIMDIKWSKKTLGEDGLTYDNGDSHDVRSLVAVTRYCAERGCAAGTGAYVRMALGNASDVVVGLGNDGDDVSFLGAVY